MPIPLEVLKRVSVVYTHAHCPDGMVSAMILKDAFRMLGTSPEIVFLAHGTPEHKSAGLTHDSSLFCDIAPHPETFETMKDAPGRLEVVVLDHHIGARDLVEAFGELGVYADAEKEPGVSGAVLAFREVWEPAWLSNDRPGNYCNLVEDFALCIGARDTWQTKDPRFLRGQWTSKMLMSKPASHWLDEFRIEVDDPRYRSSYHLPCLSKAEIEAGRALFEAHEEAVRQAVDQVVHTFVEDGGRASTGTGFGDVHTGVELYVFQEQASGFRLTSDVAESIRTAGEQQGEDRHGMVAGFAYVVDKPGDPPRIVYSLRGLGGFDVCAFAKANGGGGHKAAAGFSVAHDNRDVLDPYWFIKTRLQAFLKAR